MDLKKNITSIHQRIVTAKECYHRADDSVSLLAVSKTQDITKIAALITYGQKDFGENYVQEALPKIKSLEGSSVIWHFIGSIQSKKTKDIAQHFSWVHTVSRYKDAQYLSDARPLQLPPLNICIQVRLEDNPIKGGISPAEVPELLHQINTLPRLSIRGLMVLPPPVKDFAAQRHYFKIVRKLFDALNEQGAKLDTLSMGMTDDLEAAIAEGATMVRVGTGLFGPREG